DAAMARHNLGYVLLLEGDLVAALTEMADARRAMSQVSPVNVAIGDLDRAEVLREAGLVTEAERLLESVARTLGAHRMPQMRGEAELQLSRSLLTHDAQRAALAATSAMRRFRALGSETWSARAEGLRLRARLQVQEASPAGRATTARPERIDRAAARLEELGQPTEAVALRLTYQRWAAHLGQPNGGRVIPNLTGAPIQVQLLGDETRAAKAAAAGRVGEARRHAARGLDRLAAWTRSFGSLDLQSSIAMHGGGLVREGLAAAIRTGRPEVVFEWSERARHLNQQVVPLRPSPDPGMAADLAELRRLRADDPSGDWLADPRASALRDRARQRQWSAVGGAGLDQPASLEEIRVALGDDIALASYLVVEDTLTCLVACSDATRVLDLGSWPRVRSVLSGLRADLDVTAAIRSGPLAAVAAGALEARLVELSRLLLDEPIRLTGRRRLVLTAPGSLGGLPWSMLPAARRLPVTVAPSATRWSRGRRSSTARGAAFASGPRVRRGDEEVDTAARAWPGAAVLRGAAATVDAVTSLASGVSVLHVAAHGRHAVDNPMFSGVELVDGALFGYDIDRMPRVPDTVVLSACELGRSSVRWGEEAVGMTRAWLHAGSVSVIAAPVVVADDIACELLGAMHGSLAGGRAPAEALAAASLATGIVAPFQCHGSGI
ncbi:MAG: CHAT domain-containing protein, partial [Candidatus Limnocylindrales bacterium]